MQTAIQRKFAHNNIFLKIIRLNLSRCGQNAQRQGQIVSGTFLSQVGGSQIECYLFTWNPIAIVQKSRRNTVITFLYGIVGQTDQMVADTGIDVDLNSYGCGLYTCLLYTSPSPRDGLLSRMP